MAGIINKEKAIAVHLRNHLLITALLVESGGVFMILMPFVVIGF